MEQLLKTGTTTVGLVCKDGIILAADRKVTAGNYVMARDFEKVIIINENVAVTTAGLVSDVQLLTKVIRAQIKLDELRRGKSIKISEAANLLANLVYTNIRKMSMVQGITGFLVGGRDKTGFHLYSLGVDGSLTKYNNYCADGSGMMFALGVFESEYKNGISINEGAVLVEKAIVASLRRDTASGAGLDVVSITKDGSKKIVSKNLNERLE
ncbi:MAG TPA: proteasome subunit beta [Candidatus Nanoarchaeia archaeon]|nr:proteasome subunit beta [Candidatus Nanoarchaeia archaeon]